MTSKTVEPKVQSLKVTTTVAITIQSFGATVVTPGVMLECEVIGLTPKNSWPSFRCFSRNTTIKYRFNGKQ